MTTVLVTGAGGAAGVAVLRALSTAGVTTVAADPDPLAAGRHLADADTAVPYASDPRFAANVVDAAVAHAVDAVICTVAEEMPTLSTVTDELAAAGVSMWLSPADAVETCIDKQRFSKAAQSAGLPIPPTALGTADGIPGPWIVKPRFGRGSRDVRRVDTADALDVALRDTPDPIVQTRSGGREFTVDVLVDRDGHVAGAVPRWRIETKAGISTKGETFSDERVTGLVHRTVAALVLEGALNLQGFVTDDPEVPVVLIEVNPRFSGGLPLSLAAGADLVGEFLRGTLDQAIRPERLQHRDGVVMTRYLAEVFTEREAS
jgi:carbamoyl-phosphate synthase large subunit